VEARTPSLFKCTWDIGIRNYKILKKPNIYSIINIISTNSPDGHIQQLDDGSAWGTADRFRIEPLGAFSTISIYTVLQISGKLVEFVIRETFSRRRI